MGFHSARGAGRPYFYLITGTFAGTTGALTVPAILSSEFNVHITQDMADQALIVGVMAGAIVGLVISLIVGSFMHRYRDLASSKLYLRRLLFEALILILVNAVTLFCFVLGDIYYSDYLFPVS